MKNQILSTIGTLLLSGGLALLILPAFVPGFAGYSLLGLIPILAGLWLVSPALSEEV